MPNDLAGSATYTPAATEQLLAGDLPIKTDAGPAAADVVKYQLCAVLPAGTVTPFIAGTHTASQAILAMQTVATGKQVPYAHSGIFNDALIAYPAGAALDSYAKRRAFFSGTFKVSRLYKSS